MFSKLLLSDLENVAWINIVYTGYKYNFRQILVTLVQIRYPFLTNTIIFSR